MKTMRIAGHILGLLMVALMLMSAVMKLLRPAAVVQGFSHYGLPENLLVPLGIVELVCAVIYVIPRTSILGAILLTGYLGGAVLANLRVGEAWFPPALVGVFLWGGLYLRNPKLRALIPLTGDAP